MERAMTLDARFKRSFVPLVALLLGAAAYFQALGIREIVAAVLARGCAAAAPPWRRPPRSALASVAADHATDAHAILARNPFDSVTGSLLGGPPKPPAPEPASGDDPPCASARVVLIAASGDDGAWSFAAIAEGGEPPVLRRAGDQVAGYSVAAIGWDRVWLAAGSARCHAALGVAPRAGEPPPKPGEGAARPPARTARGQLPPEIAAGIRQISEREYEIDRSAFDAILERQAELMGQLRATPVKEGDRVVGMRLGRVRPGSVLAAIGMRDGDRLTKVNGLDVGDPMTMVQAYTRLRGADHLVVSVERGGAPVNIDLRIR
jgi:general secretion pathway protein C